MVLLAYYLHDLNPMIFKLGPITPRWYGFSYLMGFVGAYLLIKKLSRDGMLQLPAEKVPDLVLNCCIFGVLVGGRLGYCLFYDLPRALHDHVTPLLWSFGEGAPWWGLLRVNDGGMSAHGGVVFTILTLMVFAWRNKVRLVNIGDAACMVVPVGLCFGRLANFVNGELYGHATTVPWAVQFPSELIAPTNGVYDIPLGQRLGLIQRVAEQVPAYADYLTVMPRGLDGSGQYHYQMNGIIAFAQQHNPQVVEMLRNLLIARHPSQLYEAGLEGVLLFLIVWTIGRFWRKEGMAGGAFLVGYPIMRILGEQFRVGDTPLNILGIEVSKGVLYSLLMLIPAAAYWLYWIRRNQPSVWVKLEAAASPARTEEAHK